MERARRRHVPGRERLHRENERGVSVEHDLKTRALYLLARDFYGFSLDGDMRARSSRYVGRPTSSR